MFFDANWTLEIAQMLDIRFLTLCLRLRMLSYFPGVLQSILFFNESNSEKGKCTICVTHVIIYTYSSRVA
jgi:hypothetical protein